MKYVIWLKTLSGESYKFTCFGFSVVDSLSCIKLFVDEYDRTKYYLISFSSISSFACIDFTDKPGDLLDIIIKNCHNLEV